MHPPYAFRPPCVESSERAEPGPASEMLVARLCASPPPCSLPLTGAHSKTSRLEENLSPNEGNKERAPQGVEDLFSQRNMSGQHRLAPRLERCTSSVPWPVCPRPRGPISLLRHAPVHFTVWAVFRDHGGHATRLVSVAARKRVCERRGCYCCAPGVCLCAWASVCLHASEHLPCSERLIATLT
jgi:hypothetical protein